MGSDDELDFAVEWMKKNAVIDVRRNGLEQLPGEIEIEVVSIFPTDEITIYEIITHPDNHEIFRSVNRCVYRKIVGNDCRGKQLIHVENETDWSVLGLVKGSIRSKLFAEQSMEDLRLAFAQQPNSSKMLDQLFGIWQILDSKTINPALISSSQRYEELMRSDSCIVTLYQRFVPKSSIPHVLIGPFHRSVVSQIRKTFEDLYIEVRKIKAGLPTLPPYMSACMKEISDLPAPNGDIRTEDPDLIAAVLETASSASSHSHISTRIFAAHAASSLLYQSSESESSTPSTLSMYYSSHTRPISHPLDSGQCSLASLEVKSKQSPQTHFRKLLRKVHSMVDRWGASYLDIGSAEEEDDLEFHDEFSESQAQWFVVA
jgi:hypothetical protein